MPDLEVERIKLLIKMKKEQNLQEPPKQVLNIPVVRQRALKWWNSLTKGQQRDYEFKTYGYGDPFEDNALTEADCIHMYKRWILHVA